MAGAVANGVYYNTDSGLDAPGGLLDRLTQAVDNRAQYQGTLTGLAPALQQSGIPVSAPQGILSQILGGLGIGSGSQPTPAMPVARASQSSVVGNSAAAPTSGGSSAMAYAPDESAPVSGNPMAQAIGQAAQKYGIDPMTAIRVAQSEGGFSPDDRLAMP